MVTLNLIWQTIYAKDDTIKLFFVRNDYTTENLTAAVQLCHWIVTQILYGTMKNNTLVIVLSKNNRKRLVWNTNCTYIMYM